MYDVVFLHPPVSFQKLRFPLGGLFESGTGTTDLLTMMPLGMLSLANELLQANFSTVVLNVAKMVHKSRYGADLDLEHLLAQYPARVYGIDLHWVAHVSGALELARRCKRQYPTSFVMLGGLSSTFFTAELLRDHPYIDGVIQGECDGAMPDIARALLHQPPRPQDVPNLAFRGEGIQYNPRVSPSLTEVDYLDRFGLCRPAPEPGRLERESLISNITIVRGCSENCLFCGGSRTSYQMAYHRPKLEVLPVKKVVQHIERSLELGIGGVKILGDPRCGGQRYNRELVAGILELNASVDIGLELFWPAKADFLEPWKNVARDLWLSISPESSHEELRRLHGKTYDNQALLDMARDCRDLDIISQFCFCYLLPGHTPENLMQEIDFLEELLAVDPRAGVMLQPYLYLDPASPIYLAPETYGYTISLSSLATIKEAHERAYWYHTIGYATEAFSQQDFYEAILEVTRRKARLYFDIGRLSARDLLKTEKNLECQHKIGDLIQARPDLSDQAIQGVIEEVFPEYMRRSNTNLMSRPFFGEDLRQRSGPEAMIYDAFPISLELYLKRYPAKVESTYREVETWLAAHQDQLGAWLPSAELPEPLARLLGRLLQPLALERRFQEDLLHFEWDIYQVLFNPDPRPRGIPWGEGFLLTAYSYDLISMEELTHAVVTRGETPSLQSTWCLIHPARQVVTTLNFDPGAGQGVVLDARVRQIDGIWLKLLRAEELVLRALARIQKRPRPHQPRVLWEGPLTTAQLVELLGRAAT